MDNVNICQLTNFDLDDVETKEITIKKDDGKITENHLYKHITSSKLGSSKVFKLGYCVNDNQGINYPIFLNGDQEKNKIYIGKTGIYEFQPETREDAEGEEVTMIAYASELWVPADVPFCLDYCYST